MELKDITPVVIGVPLLVLIALTEGIVFYAALAVLILFMAADLSWLNLKLSDLKKLKVTRMLSHKDVRIGSPIIITTTLRHAGRRKQLLQFMQPITDNVAAKGSTEGQIRISPGNEDSFSIELTPSKGGEFTIQPLDITIESLFFRRHMAMGSAEKAAAHLKTGTVSGHSQFSMGGDKRFSEVASGSGAMGRGGTDFASIRFYVPGDETRHIDWARSSKASKLIVKEFERDLSQPVFFLIDADLSMSSGEQSDQSVAVDIAMPLVNKLTIENGRFGVARFSGSGVVDYLPLGMGREHTAKTLTIFSADVKDGEARPAKSDMPLYEANSLRSVLKQAEGMNVLSSLMGETFREYSANIKEDGFTRAISKFCASSKTTCQIVIITNISMGLGSLLNGIRIARYYGHSAIVVLTPHIWYSVNELIDPEKSYEKYAEVKNSISKIRGYGNVTVIDLGSGEMDRKAMLRGSQNIGMAR